MNDLSISIYLVGFPPKKCLFVTLLELLYSSKARNGCNLSGKGHYFSTEKALPMGKIDPVISSCKKIPYTRPNGFARFMYEYLFSMHCCLLVYGCK